MTRNKLIVALVLVLFSVSAQNQTTQDKGTLENRIADLLAQMPATDQTSFNLLMNTMAGLGENGLMEIAGMLAPPEMANDAAVRFAVGGFSNFVMATGQQENRLLCQKAWCRALETETDREIKSFLIAQLQVVGDNLAIPCLEKYLLTDQLCDPAARALVAIHTAESGRALYEAVDKVQGSSLISVTEALGDMQYTAAEAKIAALAVSPDMKLRKVALYALARLGLPQSGTLLYDAALKSGMIYEPSQATSSYLLWINRLIQNGNKTLADKRCIDLLKNCMADNQVQTRAEALSMLVSSSGEKATSYLYEAMKSNNKHYRLTALGLAQNLKGENQTRGWMKKAGKMSGQPKAEVIDMLGERGDPAALPFVQESLKDNDESVRLAAIEATSKLGKDAALPGLLEVMKKGNPGEVKAIKTQLLSFSGNAMIPAIVTALPDMPANAKIALMEILASRKSVDHAGLVLQQTSSPDTGVKLAALVALADLVTEKDLEELFSIMPRVESADEAIAFQSCVVAAVKDLPREKQAAAIVATLNKTPGTDSRLLYGILAGIGSREALQIVVTDFKNGKPDLQQAAFKALAGWSDPNALPELYAIGIQKEYSQYREAALKGSLKLISQADYTDDQRLLLLRKTMELAVTPVEKNLILKETGKCNTYTALLFTAKYLDDPDLQQEAGIAASNIALGNKSLYGDEVKTSLNKILNLLKGPESDYQKEAIRKHLAALPEGPGFLPLFNGKDLNGWKGLVENPLVRSKMKPDDLAKAQVKADEIMRNGWKVEDGILVFTGNGENLCTTKSYGDFEMIVDWKITEKGDAGIYLRGSPQVQIWDTSRRDAGAQVGSGGLYNNQVHERNPLQVADNPIGEWNTFRILMMGERVTVHLNGILVVDHVIMENYWDRSLPIFPVEQIELQAHGTWVGYRDIYIREIPRP